jgi:hypothetical protein
MTGKMRRGDTELGRITHSGIGTGNTEEICAQDAEEQLPPKMSSSRVVAKFMEKQVTR